MKHEESDDNIEEDGADVQDVRASLTEKEDETGASDEGTDAEVIVEALKEEKGGEEDEGNAGAPSSIDAPEFLTIDEEQALLETLTQDSIPHRRMRRKLLTRRVRVNYHLKEKT
jgi:hypothetical protein